MKGKVWVLDTETKGTGAHLVPLEDVLVTPRPKEHFLPPTARRRKVEPEPAPRAPRLRTAILGPPLTEQVAGHTTILAVANG